MAGRLAVTAPYGALRPPVLSGSGMSVLRCDVRPVNACHAEEGIGARERQGGGMYAASTVRQKDRYLKYLKSAAWPQYRDHFAIWFPSFSTPISQ